MAIQRIFPVIMGRMGTSKFNLMVLLLLAVLAVFAFYNFGSENENFSSTTKRIKQNQSSQNTNRNHADVSTDPKSIHPKERTRDADDLGERKSEVADWLDGQKYYHALMMFTKVDKSRNLQDKFEVAMQSMVKHGHFQKDEVLILHLVSDRLSRELGEKMLQGLLSEATFQYEVVFHDAAALTEQLLPIVESMQRFFSIGAGAYYSDAIFFLSVAIHRILPPELKRIVLLDVDLKYKSNIRDLFQEFNHFSPEAVIGIAHEMQPVYRHTFWQYRKENPGSRVGEPPPDGQPGFNSGVMLLDLEAMRRSTLYNQLLETERLAQLTDRYRFQGHLGDQDFFTMIGMEHPELFHPLACGWNRQLCTWWREHGYRDQFQLYHRCDGPIHIYHGNCNTPIPDD